MKTLVLTGVGTDGSPGVRGAAVVSVVDASASSVSSALNTCRQWPQRTLPCRTRSCSEVMRNTV